MWLFVHFFPIQNQFDRKFIRSRQRFRLRISLIVEKKLKYCENDESLDLMVNLDHFVSILKLNHPSSKPNDSNCAWFKPG